MIWIWAVHDMQPGFSVVRTHMPPAQYHQIHLSVHRNKHT